MYVSHAYLLQSGSCLQTPIFYFCLLLLGSRLPILSSPAGLPASTSGFRCWAPAGLPASTSGFSCWSLRFHFCLQLLGSCCAPGFYIWLLVSWFPLLDSAVVFPASASNFSVCLLLLGSRLHSWFLLLLGSRLPLLVSDIEQDQICLLHSEFWFIYPLSSMQGMMGRQQPIRGWHQPPQRHLGKSSALWGDGGSPWICGVPPRGYLAGRRVPSGSCCVASGSRRVYPDPGHDVGARLCTSRESMFRP